MYSDDPIEEIKARGFTLENPVQCRRCGQTLTLVRDEVGSCGLCGQRYRWVQPEEGSAPSKPS